MTERHPGIIKTIDSMDEEVVMRDPHVTVLAILSAIATFQSRPADQKQLFNVSMACKMLRDDLAIDTMAFLVWNVERHLACEIDLWPETEIGTEIHARGALRERVGALQRQFDEITKALNADRRRVLH